ncbi:plasmid pRiA4b ORF-3 family protein [Sphingobium baderi]|uniref:plasmid pRiA4b ORF-3 family protein n=2 Tax=Sphingobium TaxID=165695 RepID=UPI0015D4F5BE|nr:plasmid pRiA4b ORF-3 family protein [Sphingobium baderi]WRD77182.1 plasmid pRiA4b ORF-3 family protein [Sphingobium baderi]
MVRRMTDPFDPDYFIIVADVHIIGIEPRVSRVLELPVKLNFAQFHDVLQSAFGWTDSHLHQFHVGGLTIGAPEFNEDSFYGRRTFEASEIRLQDLTFPYEADPTLTIVYEYDFGDCWRHLISLSRQPREEGATYPRCVAGTRSGPPEDVGGYSGYADFLEAWMDPAHDDHKDMRRWAGRKFDPEFFDLDATNKAIARVLRTSKGDYRLRRARSS